MTSALPRSKADKPCLTYISCTVSAWFFLPIQELYGCSSKGHLQSLFQLQLSIPKILHMSYQKTSVVQCCIQASQSCKDQKCNTGMCKLVAKSFQDHFFTTRHVIKNFAKNWKTVCVKVCVTDLISTTYHYASKVWLIF